MAGKIRSPKIISGGERERETGREKIMALSLSVWEEKKTTNEKWRWKKNPLKISASARQTLSFPDFYLDIPMPDQTFHNFKTTKFHIYISDGEKKTFDGCILRL